MASDPDAFGPSSRVALVTGANSGLGRETARGLVRRGYEVLMASRRLERSEAVAAELKAETPGARLRAMSLDLGDLESVLRFADQVRAEYGHLDLLAKVTPPSA